jgi:hypothetical protein
VTVQDADRGHLRGLDDCLLLATGDDEGRAVVTDNISDFFRCHQRRIDYGLSHHGLLFFTNDSFPRHRHGLFVSQVIAALDRELTAHEKDDPSGWIRWLAARA